VDELLEEFDQLGVAVPAVTKPQIHKDYTDDVLDGINELMDDVEFPTKIVNKPRPSKIQYTDEVLDGIDELLYSVYTG